MRTESRTPVGLRVAEMLLLWPLLLSDNRGTAKTMATQWGVRLVLLAFLPFMSGCGSAAPVATDPARAAPHEFAGCPVHIPNRELPTGFVPGATDSDWLLGDQADPVEYRTVAFTYSGDDGPFVLVQYFRFASLQFGLVEWAHRALAAHEHAMAGWSNIDEFASSVLVYWAAWDEPAGRHQLEYALVEKGERIERYERFVQQPDGLCRATIAAHPGLPPDVAARAFKLFFDQAFASGSPPQRMLAWGQAARL